jgi:hypothetical protein
MSIGIFITLCFHSPLLTNWFNTPSISLQLFLTIHAILTIIKNIFLFILSILYPILKSYNILSPLWSYCNSLYTLKNILNDVICLSYFRIYLIENNKINLLFSWIEIELFKEELNTNINKIKYEANVIFNKYFKSGCEFETKISTTNLESVQNLINQPNITRSCFNDVQQEIFELMELEFPR